MRAGLALGLLAALGGLAVAAPRRAVLRDCHPLTYSHGALPSLDLPGHVRGGSGLVPLGARLAVIQDDVSALALVDPVTGRTALRPGPAIDGWRRFSSARGNKHAKPDLESALLLDGRLVALGSGSTPRRRQVLVAPLDPVRGLGAPEYRPAHAFYDALEKETRFAGSELNLEGAVQVGTRVALVNRGNGAPRGALEPVDALLWVPADELAAHLLRGAPPPRLGSPYPVALGELEGTRLTFTDLASDGRQLYFLAAAEASPDTYHDGEVVGSALGTLSPEGLASWARLAHPDGSPVVAKAEGLCLDGPEGAWVLLDRDDTEVPGELCRVDLVGAW